MEVMDVSQPDTMRKLQGDRVLVYRHSESGHLLLAHVMTLVRVVGVDGQEMRLVNRDSKDRRPSWAFTQVWLDKLRPAPVGNKQNAKWEVTLKAKV